MTLTQVRDQINLALEKNKDDPRMEKILGMNVHSITVESNGRMIIEG